MVVDCFKHNLVVKFTYWINFLCMHLSSKCKDDFVCILRLTVKKPVLQDVFYIYIKIRPWVLFWEEIPLLQSLCHFSIIDFEKKISLCNKLLNVDLSTLHTISAMVKCMVRGHGGNDRVKVIYLRRKLPWG